MIWNQAPGSYRTIVIIARKFYEVLKRKDVTEELELPRVKSEALPDVLNREEVAKLIKGITDLRDRLIVELLYETGARASEVAHLKTKDIQFDEHSDLPRQQD